MAAPRILIVDDDPQIRDLLRITLEREGYGILTAADGATALRMATRERPEAIVLDIGLPEVDGLDVCRRLRQGGAVPILFLSARGDEIDRVVGLELGADDYVTKPFSPRELVARIRILLKRSAPRTEAMTRGVLALDMARHLATVAGQAVALTASEMLLLQRLMQRPEHVATRAHLTEALYGNSAHVSERTLDSHLRNLRHKLSRAGCGDAVTTVHGVGVRLGPCAGD